MLKQTVTMFVGFLTFLVFGWAAGGCGGRGSTPANPGGFVIATSFHPMHVHVLNIARGVPGVTVRNLVCPTAGCLHDYQLSPREMAALESASVLVVNGAGMESFLEKAVRQYPALKVVDASRGLEMIQDHGGPNPHLWVSPPGAIGQVRNIAEGLAAADPAHAAQYRANAEAYAARLEALRRRMHAELDALPNRRVVTMHEAFPYFAKEFNLDVAGVIQREPGSDPSAGELAESVEAIRRSGVRAIFAEPQYPARAAVTIAREAGATVYTLDPAVTGPADPDAYLQAMERNLDTLRRALK